MRKTTQNPGSVKKVLGLPGLYRVRISVDGHDMRGFPHHNPIRLSLRMLATDTHGQQVVYAMSLRGEPWQKISSDRFQDLAQVIVKMDTEPES